MREQSMKPLCSPWELNLEFLPFSSSTSGLLLSPPPSHSETCMPTVCTRNFLGKPSSNLHVFLFPALRGKGFSIPAWHALSEDPVWRRVLLGQGLRKKDAAEKANGAGDRSGTQYDGEGGSRPPASSQSGAQTALQQEWYQTRQWEDLTILNKTPYLTSTACMVFLSCPADLDLPCDTSILFTSGLTNERTSRQLQSNTRWHQIEMRSGKSSHCIQAGTGHIVLVDYKNRLINDEKINCLFFQPFEMQNKPVPIIDCNLPWVALFAALQLWIICLTDYGIMWSFRLHPWWHHKRVLRLFTDLQNQLICDCDQSLSYNQ